MIYLIYKMFSKHERTVHLYIYLHAFILLTEHFLLVKYINQYSILPSAYN